MKERPLESREYSVGESVCEDILCTNCLCMREVKGRAGARLLGREVLRGSFRFAFSCLSS